MTNAIPDVGQVSEARLDLLLRHPLREEVGWHLCIYDNLADMFTKVLDRIPFVKLRKLVLNVVVRAATMVMPRARRSRAA